MCATHSAALSPVSMLQATADRELHGRHRMIESGL
jgi:hypothetical protein